MGPHLAGVGVPADGGIHEILHVLEHARLHLRVRRLQQLLPQRVDVRALDLHRNNTMPRQPRAQTKPHVSFVVDMYWRRQQPAASISVRRLQ
jgi:hypothetical protein